jgi:hypothetical protein
MEMNVRFLGHIPFDLAVAGAAGSGVPLLHASVEFPGVMAFSTVADAILAAQIELDPGAQGEAGEVTSGASADDNWRHIERPEGGFQRGAPELHLV